jgi:hypothetical protein
VAEVGTRRTFRFVTWNGEEPVEGDIIRTFTGLCYEILSWRPGRKGGATKYLVDVEVLPRDTVLFGEDGVMASAPSESGPQTDEHWQLWMEESNRLTVARRRAAA